MKRLDLFSNVVRAAVVACAVVLGFASCESGEGGGSSKSLKLQKLDLAGAKYLSLSAGVSTKAADSEAGLFKIDADGNVSAVVMTCVEQEDGSSSKVRTDIKVSPQSIVSFSGAYTYMYNCEFFTAGGQYVDMCGYYGAQGYFNILVRNSDGAIFYVPGDAEKFFPRSDDVWSRFASCVDKQGNLYVAVDGNLATVTVSGGQTVVKQINPNNISVSDEGIIPFDNGTVMAGSGQDWTAFYPNGGFESVAINGLDYLLWLSGTSDGVKAVTVDYAGNTRLEEVTLRDFSIGTSVGSASVSAPLASLTVCDEGGWGHSYGTIYETDRYYIIGHRFTYDKRSGTMQELAEPLDERFMPNATNVYKNRVWGQIYLNPSNAGVEWMDLETFESGRTDFDLSVMGDFVQTGGSENIPEGEIVISGVRNADGKQVVGTIDIMTGSVKVGVNDDTRQITTLVPLN